MTQEEKDVLIRDICARLPYNTYCHIKSDRAEIDDINTPNTIEYFDIWDIKPYLRPMSSMTEKEIGEYKCLNDALDENYEVHIDNAYPAFDWLNANHFDYRGLISKGLALEAPEDMYD